MNQAQNCLGGIAQQLGGYIPTPIAAEPLVKIDRAQNGWLVTVRHKGVFVALNLEAAIDIIERETEGQQ